MLGFIPIVALLIILGGILIIFKKPANLNSGITNFNNETTDEANGIISKSITIPDSRFGDKFIFSAYRAEVVSEPQVWSETHISSSGGGGYVHPEHGGHVSAPTISSEVIERQRYFVRYKNGNESEIRDAVAARKGNELWIIFGGFHGDNYLIATYNLNTNKYLLENLRYKKYFFWTYLQPWWLKLLLFVLSIPYVIPAYFLIKKIRWENTIKNDLDNAVDNLIKIL